MNIQVSELKQGEWVRITKVGNANPAYRKRLLAMGFLPDTQFFVSRIAPFGDPVEIHIRGTQVSLRKAEASLLQIEKI